MSSYTTVISPVREVTLRGKADAGLWQIYLKDEGVKPFIQDDKAELLLSAVDSKYMGFRFQEFSISLRLADDAYFLAHAFNSIPVFAWVERQFFRTPYFPARIVVEKDRLILNDGRTFEAKLASQAPCVKSGDEDQQLLIRLPKALRQRRASDKPHFFYARLEGYTETYQATLENLSVQGEEAIFQALRDSEFQVEEWHVRENARHSKSKTYHE